MIEHTQTTLTADELIRRAHEAAAADDAQKEREAQEFLAEQARKADLKRQEQADQLRAQIHQVCGFEIDLTPTDLEPDGAWSVHPLVHLFVERWIGHPTPILKLTARRPGVNHQVQITTLADLSCMIQAAEAYEAKLAAEREAKRREREEATRRQAERDTQRAELERERSSIESDDPHMDAVFVVDASGDALLLRPQAADLGVTFLNTAMADRPFRRLVLDQATVERLAASFQPDEDETVIVEAPSCTILVSIDSETYDTHITWICEDPYNEGWIVYQRWLDVQPLDTILSAWLGYRQKALAWEAKLRVIDEKLAALCGSDYDF